MKIVEVIPHVITSTMEAAAISAPVESRSRFERSAPPILLGSFSS